MLKNFFEKIGKMALAHEANPSRFIITSTVAIFSISSIGEALGVYINKKIPEKEKRFMIMQDLLEGVFKIGLFLTLSLALEKLFQTLVLKGKVLPFKELTPETFKDFKDGFKTVGALLGTFLSFNLIAPIVRNPLANYLQKNVFKGKEVKDKSVLTYRGPELPALKLQSTVKTNSQNPFEQFERTMQLGRINNPNLTFTSRGMRI